MFTKKNIFLLSFFIVSFCLDIISKVNSEWVHNNFTITQNFHSPNACRKKIPVTPTRIRIRRAKVVLYFVCTAKRPCKYVREPKMGYSRKFGGPTIPKNCKSVRVGRDAAPLRNLEGNRRRPTVEMIQADIQ